MTEQRRNYGIDLLRILLMLLIIWAHLYSYTGVNKSLPFLSSKWIFTWFTFAATVSAVNCYIIITGYYMSKIRYDLYKIIKLWCKVLFYSIALTTVLLMCGTINISFGTVLNTFFPVLRKEYWFFTMYILLYLLIPFINAAINNMSKKMHQVLVCIILAFFYLEPLLSVIFYQYDPTKGYGIIIFVTLYIIGAFMARCDSEIVVKKRYYVLILFASMGIMCLSKIFLQFIIDKFALTLGTALLYHHDTVFVLINAIVLFKLFKQIEINNPKIQKLIKWVGPSVFSVYLLHEKPAVRKLIWNDHLSRFLKQSDFWLYLVSVLLLGSMVFVVCVIIDKILDWLLFKRLANSFVASLLKEKCIRYNEVVSQQFQSSKN